MRFIYLLSFVCFVSLISCKKKDTITPGSNRVCFAGTHIFDSYAEGFVADSTATPRVQMHWVISQNQQDTSKNFYTYSAHQILVKPESGTQSLTYYLNAQGNADSIFQEDVNLQFKTYVLYNAQQQVIYKQIGGYIESVQYFQETYNTWKDGDLIRSVVYNGPDDSLVTSYTYDVSKENRLVFSNQVIYRLGNESKHVLIRSVDQNHTQTDYSYTYADGNPVSIHLTSGGTPLRTEQIQWRCLP